MSVKITGVFDNDPSGVFGRYNVAFNSTLSRMGIFSPSEGHNRLAVATAMVGLGVCATTIAAKGAHSVVAMIDVHEIIVASEEVRSFTLSDSSEEEPEGKNVDYGSLLLGWPSKEVQATGHRLQEGEFARR